MIEYLPFDIKICVAEKYIDQIQKIKLTLEKHTKKNWKIFCCDLDETREYNFHQGKKEKFAKQKLLLEQIKEIDQNACIISDD